MTTFLRRLPFILVALLLASMFTLEATTAWQESQTIDEAVHLSAGLSYVKTGDFRLNPEHPPLIKELAAFPLLFTSVKLPLHDATWHNWDQYAFGSLFLYHNTLPAQLILFLGRLPIMLLSLLLGWWIFRTSKELFGPWGGVLSLSLYALDPGFIAHGHYVTTDVGFTALSFWAVLRWRKLLDAPTRKNAIIFGASLWLAGLSKFSMVPFLGVMILVGLLLKWREPQHPALSLRRVAKATLVALPILMMITWAFYGFDVRRPANDPRITQLYGQRLSFIATHNIQSLSPIVRFAVTQIGNTSSSLGGWLSRSSHTIVPGYAFFRGVITVIGHSIGGQEAYLHGHFSDTGWWYYFPVAIMVKSTLPTLLAIVGVWTIVIVRIVRAKKSGLTLRQIVQKADRTWIIFLAVPTFFLLASMSSHLDLGWRYVLPIYPYMFVLAGVLTTSHVFKNPRLRLIVPLVLGLGMVVTQIETYPNELGYFNSIAGGSTNGSNWLLDSNLDWGQDVPKLAAYMKQQNIATLPFAYYGWADTHTYVNTPPLPTTADILRGQIVHGLVAISIGNLKRRDQSYSWLNPYQPEARVGSSILIFKIP